MNKCVLTKRRDCPHKEISHETCGPCKISRTHKLGDTFFMVGHTLSLVRIDKVDGEKKYKLCCYDHNCTGIQLTINDDVFLECLDRGILSRKYREE